MPVRILSLDDVNDELLAECGLQRGAATSESYRCREPAAVLIPTANIIGPTHRKLNRDVVVKILKGFREHHFIPPVEIFYEPGPATFHLLDGMHRWRASLAFGFVELPCLLMDRDWAEQFRGYKPEA